MRVDTHCHAAPDWYEPAEALLAAMDRAGVGQAWLIPLLGRFDNGYALAQAAAHPDRFDAFVQVDWERADAVEGLHRLADAGARGVRLRPVSRSPGADPFAIWRAAQTLGLIVSCVGTAAQFAAQPFFALAAEFAALTIVLEHLGGLARPDAGEAAVAKVPVFALARFPNLHLKLPGLGQLLARADLEPPPSDPADPLVALITEALAAFGPESLLWGSDFPVVSSREGYANALHWAEAVVPAAARAVVFGGNAARLLKGTRR